MKKFIVLILLLFSIFSNTMFANPVESFIESIAYSIFKAAWPTAEYKEFEIFKHETTETGHYLIIRFTGESSFCFLEKCVLKLDLGITTNSDFNIKNIQVIKHNAIMVEPFASASALLEILKNK